jgi:hypothetical protein
MLPEETMLPGVMNHVRWFKVRGCSIEIQSVSSCARLGILKMAGEKFTLQIAPKNGTAESCDR